MSKFTAETAMFGHTDEESAYVVDDYPYGYTLRTQIRYWIETTKHGDRFVSQTMNPKTGRWNKPKKSTYCLVAALMLDENGHVKYSGIGLHSDDAYVENFYEVTKAHLSEAQRGKLAEIWGYKRAMEGVTFEIHRGPFTPEDAAEQRKIQGVILGRIDRETRGAKAALDAIS